MQWQQDDNRSNEDMAGPSETVLGILKGSFKTLRKLQLLFFRLKYTKDWFKCLLILQTWNVPNCQSSEEALTRGFGEQAPLLPKQTDDYRKNCCTRWELVKIFRAKQLGWKWIGNDFSLCSLKAKKKRRNNMKLIKVTWQFFTQFCRILWNL